MSFLVAMITTAAHCCSVGDVLHNAIGRGSGGILRLLGILPFVVNGRWCWLGFLFSAVCGFKKFKRLTQLVVFPNVKQYNTFSNIELPESHSLFEGMAFASYDAQLQIRREAEEHSAAHHEFSSWADEMKSKSLTTEPQTAVNDNARAVAKKKESAYSCERLQGNSYFAQGKYMDAIQCYTRYLVKSDVRNSLLVYSNRGKFT